MRCHVISVRQKDVLCSPKLLQIGERSETQIQVHAVPSPVLPGNTGLMHVEC